VIQFIKGDARKIPLADESVQCVVTSPPYWGLRKYAGEQNLIWGGAVNCEHDFSLTILDKSKSGTKRSGLTNAGASQCASNRFTATHGTCLKCGAWHGAYGLEPTVEMYVEHSVLILREIRRVLRKDGVCFWNIGDCYAAARGYSGSLDTRVGDMQKYVRGSLRGPGQPYPHREPQNGLKSKDLVLMPARIALAAQADGWWVRSDIIWAKSNPMPESVKDRPTDSYEHILMLTKSQRYFWDIDAVRESFNYPERRYRKFTENHKTGKLALQGNRSTAGLHDGRSQYGDPEKGRNLRNLWTFATTSYSGTHFATFPEELPRRCIKAASRPGDLILDPFAGSGTTGRVAIELGRRVILIDLAYGDGEYQKLAKDRTSLVQIELGGGR